MVKVRFVSGVALCLLMLACGGDSDEGEKAQRAVTDEFVGTANAEDAYVAVHTSNAKTNGQFDVVAYVCNRQVPLQGSVELAEWFTGTGRNNTIDLRSQAGTSRLKATVEQDRVHGTVELPNGKTAPFEAKVSTGGPAGLFDVGLDDQGNLVGTSRGGKTLTLRQFERDGQLGYQGTITAPDGATVSYELFIRGGHITKQDLADMKSPRTIILPDSTSRGILDPIARKGTERSTLSGS
ncbi:MAG: hypothetical protein M3314_13310 [Actinomycetota bacterium]|nr:hypothetical protein [Actinomycetota bacterium]